MTWKSSFQILSFEILSNAQLPKKVTTERQDQWFLSPGTPGALTTREEQVSVQIVWSPRGIKQAGMFPTRKFCDASIRNHWSCEREVFTSRPGGTGIVKQSFENLSLKRDCCVGCFCFCLFFKSFLRSHMYINGSVVFYKLKSRVNFWSCPISPLYIIACYVQTTWVCLV